MLASLRIRGKLALVVALPLLAVALLTLPGVTGAMGNAQRADEIRRSMHTANQVGSLVGELRQERLLSLGHLFGLVGRSQLAAQSVRTTDGIADIQYDAEQGLLPGGELSGPVTAALADAQALVGLRERVLAGTATPGEVIAEYGAVAAALIDSLELLDGLDLANPAARQVAALEASLHINEVGSHATHHLVVVAATGDPASATLYLASLLRVDDHTARFTRNATPEQTQQLGLLGNAYEERDETGVGELLGADPYQVAAGQPLETLFAAIESLSRLGRFVESKVITDVLVEVEAQGDAALRTAYLVVAGAVLVVVVVVALTTLLARTVSRPLLGLTASASRVAQVADAELARIADDEIDIAEPVRLEPFHTTARDEIGDLARAFDRVQDTAVRLVERQVASRRNVAVMFGFLGRRTQNLVGRQVAIIDALEQNETDSGRLADLYRLDHVSSRLRRNAGSLVALSGSVGADEHVAPRPLADVVRLALGEIEEYGRVDVSVPPTIAVVPAVIGDLVLVLAELMENAATFSPPHTRVAVTAVTLATGVDVYITDHGIGMPPERLAAENARLFQRERLDLAPTEVLGLFVVGRLARRHGLRVNLSDTSGGGVTAVVTIDRRLLAEAEVVPRVVGTATPPDNGRPGPASPPQPAGRSLVPVTSSAQPPLVDLEVLGRASRVLEAGRRWNAFALPQAPALPPAPQASPAPQAAPPEPAAPIEQRAGLRRRVPGATLREQPPPPATVGRPPGAPSAPADPDEARRLIEQLEDGVTRALSEIRLSGTEEKHDER